MTNTSHGNVYPPNDMMDVVIVSLDTFCISSVLGSSSLPNISYIYTVHSYLLYKSLLIANMHH